MKYAIEVLTRKMRQLHVTECIIDMIESGEVILSQSKIQKMLTWNYAHWVAWYAIDTQDALSEKDWS